MLHQTACSHVAHTRACSPGIIGVRNAAARRPRLQPAPARALQSAERVNGRSTQNSGAQVVSRPYDVKLVEAKGGTFSVRGSLTSSINPQDVYTVLTDHDSLPQIFSNILDSQLIRTGDTIQLQQVCRWEFLIFSGMFNACLEVQERPDTHDLTFKLLYSSFMKDFEGRWQVEQQEGGGCNIHHFLTVQPMLAPPALLGDYAARIFIKQATNILEDFQVELQRRHQFGQFQHSR